jgi:hypothetical protein
VILRAAIPLLTSSNIITIREIQQRRAYVNEPIETPIEKCYAIDERKNFTAQAAAQGGGTVQHLTCETMIPPDSWVGFFLFRPKGQG